MCPTYYRNYYITTNENIQILSQEEYYEYIGASNYQRINNACDLAFCKYTQAMAYIQPMFKYFCRLFEWCLFSWNLCLFWFVSAHALLAIKCFLLSPLVDCSESSGKHHLRFPATAFSSIPPHSMQKCGWFFYKSTGESRDCIRPLQLILWSQGTCGYWICGRWHVQIETWWNYKLHIILWR